MNAKQKNAGKSAESAPALSFEDAAPVTAVGRPKSDNPFTAPVQRLSEDWNEKDNTSAKGLRFVIPTKDLSKTRRRLTEAGDALTPPRSIRISTEAEGDKTHVTFSLREKITRKAKSAASSTEATDPAANAAK